MLTLHLLGDSLVKAYGNDIDNFIGGWGDHLGSFFDADQVTVDDYGNGGRSTRSFLNEGRFIDNGMFTKNDFPYGLGPAYDRIKEGDYCLLEFCHNDDSSKGKATYVERMTPLGDPDENGIYPTVVPIESMKSPSPSSLPGYPDKHYAYGCGATYKGYHKFYIDKIREKGAVPVIVTAPARQFWNNGKIVSIPGNHGGTDEFGDFAYIRALRQIGDEENVAVVDLFDFSVRLFEMLGESDAEYLQSIIGFDDKTLGECLYDRPAKWPEEYDEYRRKKNFKRVDDTHTNRFGSFIYAGVIAAQLAEQCGGLSAYRLKNPSKSVLFPAGLKDRIEEINSLMTEYHCSGLL